jgi:hypothetical protein
MGTEKPDREQREEGRAGDERLTAGKASVEEEKEPGFLPQTPSQVARKIETESGDAGLGERARVGLEEADREVSGEYERRQEQVAAEQPLTAEEPKQSRP